MSGKIRILGFAGSLQKSSFNKAFLRAAMELVPGDAELEIFDLEGIPQYNADLESTLPVRVREFKSRIRAADAILIATPEYNHSITGVLKNAIDWASRPPGDNSFNDKPVAIMSASVGMLGGARAQFHLRHVFVNLNMHAVNQPQVFVNAVEKKIDGEGRLVDELVREKIREL